MYPLRLNDVVRLLTGERPEQFPNERAINLFQFQVWMLYPEKKFVDLAGLTAATKIIDRTLDDIFAGKEDARQRSESPWLRSFVNLNDRPALTVNEICAHQNDVQFRAVYDNFIANLGGLPALLNALPPPKLDAEIRKRIENCPVVSDLIDYRLRYARTTGAEGNASTLRHAKFFVWYPTRQMTGRQGVRVPGKSPSTKTMDHWWKQWKRSAVFLFLNDRCGFSQFPAAADDDFFAKNLLESADDVRELRRFFGAYAFVSEVISPNQKALVQEMVPESIPRVPVEVATFTPDELDTIAAYEENSILLGNYQPGDDD